MKLRFFSTTLAIELNGKRSSSAWTEGDSGVKRIECLGGGVIHIEFDEDQRRDPLVITPSGWGVSGEARSEPMALKKVSGRK